MKKLSLTLAAVAFAAAGVHADWLLNSYATPTTDSATTNALYGYQTFGNKASTTTVTVPSSGGMVEFAASTIASDASKPYSANVGLLAPLTPDWAPHDISALTAVKFDIKLSNVTATALKDVRFTFSSAAWPKTLNDNGYTYGFSASGSYLPAVGAWKTVTIPLAQFGLPKYAYNGTGADATNTVTGLPEEWDTISLATVLSQVKNVQFQPEVIYTVSSKGTLELDMTPALTSETMDIRNITLVNVSPVVTANQTHIGCEEGASYFVLDDFGGPDGGAKTDLTQNRAGGYWYTYNDTDSTGAAVAMANSDDTAKGSSSSALSFVAGDEGAAGMAVLTASLNKMDGGKYHKYAGWADIGTEFAGKATTDLTGLTGIAFDIINAAIDSTIQEIDFKVAQHGVSNDATHFATVARSDVQGVTSYTVCTRPSDLAQPSYLTTRAAIDVSKIDKLSWEVKITDNKTASINKASATFGLTNVRLYGLTKSPSGIKGHMVRGTGFSATYRQGVLSLKDFDGIQKFDVVSLDGKKVASFAPMAQISLSLSRGTYFLTGTRQGARVVKSFEVLGR